MKKRIIITVVILTVVHFILAIGSVMISFGSGMEAFDNPDYKPSMIERIADPLAGILMQPGMSLWTPWMSKKMPDVVEWGLCLFNSLLWGIVLDVILNTPTLLKGKKPDSNGVRA